MSSYIRAFFIFIKRALCKPFTLIFLSLIPLLALAVSKLPPKEMSAEIKTGIFFETYDQEAAILSETLTDNQEEFIFECCDTEKELKENVATGVYDCGFALYDGYEASVTDGKYDVSITMYTSPDSMFQYVSMEKLYACILKLYAPYITDRYANEKFGVSYEDFIKSEFQKYMDTNSVFTIEISGNDSYIPVRQNMNTFPIYEFTGLIIFICSLLGVLNYFSDEKNHSYDSLSKRRRLMYCITNIAAGTIPAAIIGYITLIIYDSSIDVIRLAAHMLLYIIICIIYSIIYRLIFRTHHIYQTALPIIIIISLLFTPSIIDITKSMGLLKYLAVLFANYFF